jgi:hypothetical protein
MDLPEPSLTDCIYVPQGDGTLRRLRLTRVNVYYEMGSGSKWEMTAQEDLGAVSPETVTVTAKVYEELLGYKRSWDAIAATKVGATITLDAGADMVAVRCPKCDVISEPHECAGKREYGTETAVEDEPPASHRKVCDVGTITTDKDTVRCLRHEDHRARHIGVSSREKRHVSWTDRGDMTVASRCEEVSGVSGKECILEKGHPLSSPHWFLYTPPVKAVILGSGFTRSKWWSPGPSSSGRTIPFDEGSVAHHYAGPRGPDYDYAITPEGALIPSRCESVATVSVPPKDLTALPATKEDRLQCELPNSHRGDHQTTMEGKPYLWPNW